MWTSQTMQGPNSFEDFSTPSYLLSVLFRGRLPGAVSHLVHSCQQTADAEMTDSGGGGDATMTTAMAAAISYLAIIHVPAQNSLSVIISILPTRELRWQAFINFLKATKLTNELDIQKSWVCFVTLVLIKAWAFENSLSESQ